MRYIVRNKETGMYLCKGGEWTSSLNNAQSFPNGLSVVLHLEPLNGGHSSELCEVIPLPASA